MRQRMTEVEHSTNIYGPGVAKSDEPIRTEYAVMQLDTLTTMSKQFMGSVMLYDIISTVGPSMREFLTRGVR